MSPITRSTLVLFALSLASLAPGCGGSTPSPEAVAVGQQKQTLQEVGEMYRIFVATTKKAPTRVEDFAGSRQVTPLGNQAVSSGAVVVQWGALLKDTSEEGSTDSADEVLAYEKTVPEQGGMVLMKNRTVRSMTADQFKAAPKAAK